MIITLKHKNEIMGKDSPGVARYKESAEQQKNLKKKDASYSFSQASRFISVVSPGKHKDDEA